MFDYLRDQRSAGKKYDRIILDPAKLAISKLEVPRALSAYADVLEHQSDEQDSLGNREYSVALSRTADEARRLVALVTSAMEA